MVREEGTVQEPGDVPQPQAGDFLEGKETEELPPAEGEGGKSLEGETGPEDPEEEPVEDDPAVLERNPGVPSDESLCKMIENLLKPPSAQGNVKSRIVQAVLLAHGVSLEEDRPMASLLSAKLKLATHLLTEGVAYSSECLSETFAINDPRDEALRLSAYLFAMLTPSAAYDYSMKARTGALLSDFEHSFPHYRTFKSLYNKLLSVWDISAIGFTPAMVARLGGSAEMESFLLSLRQEARNNLEVQAPHKSLKSLPAFYANNFGSGSDLYSCMELIAEGKQDSESAAFIEAVLERFCDKKDETFVLSPQKVESVLKEEWARLESYRLDY